MSPTLTCLALALVGAELGYQPAPNGGEEFIVQINPATLQAIQRGGGRIDLAVPREARDTRPSLVSVTLGNEPLPHMLPPVAASSPPATAPIVTASPVLPAAAMSAPPAQMPSAEEPLRVGPPASYRPPKSSVAHGGPLLIPTNSVRSSATSADRRIAGFPPLNADGSNATQPDRPWWLAMCLLVIAALLGSNVYVGWLFWDARQRYRGLLARAFSFGQPAAEA